MIVLGPFTAILGSETQTIPLSTDTYAIGLVNASPYFMTALEAGTYAQMAVPPFTADVFLSPDTASQSITIVFASNSIQTPFATNLVSYSAYYIYLYGANDPIAIAIQHGNATGYPYSLSGLKETGPFLGTIVQQTPAFVAQQGVVALSQTFLSPPHDFQFEGGYLWGFDITTTANSSTAVHTTFQLKDVCTPGNVLNFAIDADSAHGERYIIRFPWPLAMVGGQSPGGSFGSFTCTFSFPAIGNETVCVNAYISQ